MGNTGSSVQRDIMDFTCPRPSAPVLIVSYETFRNYKDFLYGDGKVDLLICDEVNFFRSMMCSVSVSTDAFNHIMCIHSLCLSPA